MERLNSLPINIIKKIINKQVILIANDVYSLYEKESKKDHSLIFNPMKFLGKYFETHEGFFSKSNKQIIHKQFRKRLYQDVLIILVRSFLWNKGVSTREVKKITSLMQKNKTYFETLANPAYWNNKPIAYKHKKWKRNWMSYKKLS